MKASQQFKQLFELASDALDSFQNIALSPEKQKKLKEWGITDAAAMIGKTPQTLRTLESQNKIPAARTKNKGKREERVYSLKEINYLRDYFKTRPSKPKNAPTAIIAIVNFKGGATKSHTALHFAQNFALKGYRILLIDCDSQGTSTHTQGLIPDKDVTQNQTLLNILIGQENDLSKLIVPTHWDGIDLIPANLGVFNAELIIPTQIAEHVRQSGRPLAFYARLHQALAAIKDNYDIILLDAPPALNMATINIMYAANGIIIPMPPNLADFSSTKQFFLMAYETLERLPEISYSFIRILLSRYKTASASTKELADVARHFLGQYIMSEYMIDSEAVSKAATNLKTIYEVEPHANEKRTFDRAIKYADMVYEEIETLIKLMWERYQNLPQKEALEVNSV